MIQQTARERLAQLEIRVLICSALPIEQERQAFCDQNLLVQRPSVSLAHYFDRRSPHVLIAKHLAETIPQFEENIEYIQNGLGTHNPKLLTLSTLVTALQFIFPHLKNPDNLENYYQWSTQYWQLIADSLTDNPWQPYPLDRRKQQRQKDLRVSAVFFQAIGMIGQDFYQQELEFDAIQTRIKQLNQLDWDKDNRFWLDKGVTQIGTKNKPIVSNTRTTIKLCYQVLREQLELIPQPATN
ncbi:MAG: DNA sulfur modification protein DndB [Synechocystis sp.]